MTAADSPARDFLRKRSSLYLLCICSDVFSPPITGWNAPRVRGVRSCFYNITRSHHCTASRSQSLMLHSQSSITHSRFPALEMWHSSSARIGKKTHYITFFLGGPALWWCWYGAMTSGIDSISLIDNCIRTQIWLEDELQRYSRPISLVSLGHKYPSVS